MVCIQFILTWFADTTALTSNEDNSADGSISEKTPLLKQAGENVSSVSKVKIYRGSHCVKCMDPK